MCNLRLLLVLQYEVVTFGFLPSVAFLWFLNNVPGPYIHPKMLFKNQRKATLVNNPKVVTAFATLQYFHLVFFVVS
jgi:hypothetical protein